MQPEFKVTVELNVKADNASTARIIVGEMLLPSLDPQVFSLAVIKGEVLQLEANPENSNA